MTENHFGTVIEDPHRWMENTASAEFRDWVTAQGEAAERWFAARPDREDVVARVAKAWDGLVELSNVQVAATGVHCMVRGSGEDVPSLVRLDPGTGAAEVLVAPDRISLPDVRSHISIDWYTPSPDGRHIAVGVSHDGTEDHVLLVVDRHGEFVPDLAVPRIMPLRTNRASIGGVAWAPDSSGFCYLQWRELREGDDPATRYQDAATCYRAVDRLDVEHVLLRGSLDPEVGLDPDDVPLVTFADRDTLVATIVHGSAKERTLHLADAAGLGSPSRLSWRRVAVPADAVHVWTAGAGYLYTGGPVTGGWRIDRVPLDDPAPGNRRLVATGHDEALEDIGFVRDRLLLRCLVDGAAGLRVVRPDEGADVVPVRLPFPCGIPSWGWTDVGDVHVLLSSWTRPPGVWRLDQEASALVPVPAPGAAGDVADAAVSWQEQVTASDGVEVPLTIVGAPGVRRDGERPVLLTAYGFFGITLRPAYNPALRVWTDLGGLFAVAHVRGGGDRGDDWYRAGHREHKERTIQDFLDCAEHLVARGYTAPRLITAEGTSAGGLTVGGAMVRRPDAFGAVVLRVSLTNTLRLEMHENGPPNIPEYGTVTTPEGLAALLITDTCRRVRDDVAYPPVLLTVGLNDTRVLPWQPAKLTAALQAAAGSRAPVLLRVEHHGGHGVGASKNQIDGEFADRLTFALAHLREEH
ncbi:prolyl oligopeptidase family serine peptidase [Lentzea fradiae]|uniref:prolyl oligopeptidase family serine peptidase n=1 Tax=Lentzea fradiae TaxID=200378 RepID=UPI0015A1E569|nr:prolyl oligopeptidase family serine peptidase [Lentzea fradiae]